VKKPAWPKKTGPSRPVTDKRRKKRKEIPPFDGKEGVYVLPSARGK